MYGKELRCLNTKGKYGKVTNTVIKWSIISKSVMIIIFVEFIDQLIDYPINRASLNKRTHGQHLNNIPSASAGDNNNYHAFNKTSTEL